MTLLLLPSSLYFYMITNLIDSSSQEVSESHPLVQLAYLIPNFSFGVIALEIYVPGGALKLLGVNVTVAWTCLALATPFYLIVYVYLDAVIPNVYGIH